MRQPLHKTKIAFLIRSLACGGAERHLATLVKALDKEAFEVTVITFYGGGQFESEVLSHKTRVICLQKLGRFEIVRFLWRLVRELRRLRPAILYSYLVEPNVIAVLLKAPFPKLRVIWSIQATDMRTRQEDWFQRVTFRLQCFLSRFADLIIATSPAAPTIFLVDFMSRTSP